jgi:hypothetical protein
LSSNLKTHNVLAFQDVQVTDGSREAAGRADLCVLLPVFPHGV